MQKLQSKKVVPLALLLCVLWLSCFTETFADLTDRAKAIKYLRQFGYLEEAQSFRDIVSDKSLRDAVLEFQRFSGLEETGVLDQTTHDTMEHSRCGVKDIVGHSTTAKRRRKRYSHEGSKWKIFNNRTRKLRYRVSTYPSSIRDRRAVDTQIAKAFKAWSDVTKLTFEERSTGRVNIDVRFEERIHGDGSPFDGPGNTLAHAFAPLDRMYGGDIHFDDEERWSLDEIEGKNLYKVAVHEIGHSLGLLHSDKHESVMWPDFEQINSLEFRLYEDDIQGVQTLYGKAQPVPTNEVDEPSGPPPDLSNAPNICQDSSIDTIVRTANGNTYLFKGYFYWKLLSEGIANGYPRRIRDEWNGLPGNLDAAFTRPNGETFFFKGGLYWRFTNRHMDPNYPKNISSGFQRIPDNIDAAFVWSGNGKTYFFKGEKYWRYDSDRERPVSVRYPKPISNWQGLPNNIDAIFQRKDSKSYFFKGQEYYKFDDAKFAVDDVADPPYPRKTALWLFDCGSTSHPTIPSEMTNDMNEIILERESSNSFTRSRRSMDDNFETSSSKMHNVSHMIRSCSSTIYNNPMLLISSLLCILKVLNETKF